MPCWVCGADAGLQRLPVADADRGEETYDVDLCAACRSGRIDKFPSAEVLGGYYDRSYYGGGKRKFAAPLQALVNLSVRRLARSIMVQLGARASPEILDIGCGRGYLLAELGKIGARGMGLERSAVDVARGIPTVDIRAGELAQQHFPDAGFDAVIIWHVLEHLADPQQTLQEVRRILKPGGVLLIAVPNNASWQAGCFGSAWFHLDVPRHLHFFGHAGMLMLLRRQDYKTIAASTSDPVQNVYGFIQSVLNRLIPAAPNRLYQLMRSAQTPAGVLELGLWLLPAALLAPVAMIEYAWSGLRGRGACSIVYARKPGASVAGELRRGAERAESDYFGQGGSP